MKFKYTRSNDKRKKMDVTLPLNDHLTRRQLHLVCKCATWPDGRLTVALVAGEREEVKDEEEAARGEFVGGSLAQESLNVASNFILPHVRWVSGATKPLHPHLRTAWHRKPRRNITLIFSDLTTLLMFR